MGGLGCRVDGGEARKTAMGTQSLTCLQMSRSLVLAYVAFVAAPRRAPAGSCERVGHGMEVQRWPRCARSQGRDRWKWECGKAPRRGSASPAIRIEGLSAAVSRASGRAFRSTGAIPIRAHMAGTGAAPEAAVAAWARRAS